MNLKNEGFAALLYETHKSYGALHRVFNFSHFLFFKKDVLVISIINQSSRGCYILGHDKSVSNNQLLKFCY